MEIWKQKSRESTLPNRGNTFLNDKGVYDVA